jgi:hypothetical protein
MAAIGWFESELVISEQYRRSAQELNYVKIEGNRGKYLVWIVELFSRQIRVVIVIQIMPRRGL